MEFVLLLLLLSSAFALEDSMLKYAKARLDKAKYPNLNFDKVLEIDSDASGRERVENRITAFFCRSEEKGCRANVLSYLDSYDVKIHQDQLSKGQSTLNLAAYKDKADCNNRLHSICKGPNEAKCKKAGSALCDGFFANKDAVQYGKQYFEYKAEFGKLHDEFAKITDKKKEEEKNAQQKEKKD